MSLRLRSWTAALVGVAVLAATGCGSGSDDGGGAGSGGETGAIRVTDVWARTSPMEARNGAVYARIRNTSDRADALVGASVPSSVAATVELHETVMGPGGEDHGGGMGGDGGMKMQPVDRIGVPPDGTRVLKPGGYHIMLLDLAGALKVGESFPVTLRFERAGTIKVTAEVRR
jgi:copper(I)-binding protein